MLVKEYGRGSDVAAMTRARKEISVVGFVDHDTS
jgi:hypothetical protein